MNTLADIFALCIMAAATGFVGLVLTGAVRMFRAARRARLDGERFSLRGNPYAETGISAVVLGPQSPHQVERRLSQNYVRYEIILVTDFEVDPFCRGLLKKYSLIKTDWTHTADPGSAEIRSVYRSRQRRYRRLVVVDHRRTTPAQGFNCGLVASSYEHAICLDGRTFLYKEALAMLNDEFLLRSNGEIPCAVRLSGTGDMPYGRIDTAVRTALFGTGFGTAGRRDTRIAEITLLPRGRVMEAGGFRDDFRPEAELLHRLKVCAGTDCRRLRIKRIPIVIAEEEFTAVPAPPAYPSGCGGTSTGSDPDRTDLSERRPRERTLPHIPGNLPAWVVGLFWSAVLILTVWAAAMDMQDALKKGLLIFLVGYLATVAAASAALTGYGKMFLRPSPEAGPSPYLIFSVLTYPFYRLHKTLSAKNFRRS